MTNYEALPDDLPVPVDDGSCDHLIGMTVPDLDLPTTNGGQINFAQLARKTVIYCYPKTGVPGVALPDGWDRRPVLRSEQ